MNTEMMTGETMAEYSDRLIAAAEAEARARWGRCTAYRVGRQLGEAGVEMLLGPYSRANAQSHFSDGIADGLRIRRAERLKTPNDAFADGGVVEGASRTTSGAIGQP